MAKGHAATDDLPIKVSSNYRLAFTASLSEFPLPGKEDLPDTFGLYPSIYSNCYLLANGYAADVLKQNFIWCSPKIAPVYFIADVFTLCHSWKL